MIIIRIKRVPTYFIPWLTEVFAEIRINGQVMHWWSVITASYEHALYLREVTSNHWFLLVHMFTNLSILWFFGRKVEKNYGTDRFAIVSCAAFVTDAIMRMVLLSDVSGYTCGASGIVFAYIPFGIFLLIQSIRKDKDKSLLKVQACVMTIWMIYLYIIITLISGLYTFIYHIVATITGAGCLLIFNKLEKKGFKFRQISLWSVLVLLVPVILIIVLYLLVSQGIIIQQYKWL